MKQFMGYSFKQSKSVRLMVALASLALALCCAMPIAALAQEPEASSSAASASAAASESASSSAASAAPALESESSLVVVENHAAAGQQRISGIELDDVDAPEVGAQLDDKARVTTAEGEEWDVPVLWVRDDLTLATQAEADRAYLPAIAFFVPQDYSIDGGSYQVKLSASLTKLFGTRDIVSVYDTRTGITYILPATLRDFFTSANAATYGGQPTQSAQATQDAQGTTPSSEQTQVALVDIYCAQTARESFSDDDLEWLLDLVLNTLQPQAVELLLDKFPTFDAGAADGQIGREIGLYVYFRKGDVDGDDAHEGTPSNALAFVNGKVVEDGDDVRFTYMIGIDLESLLAQDKDGKPLSDEVTGKFVLVRDGEAMRTLENTIVHEMFHAFMDDYNRVGMLGATDLHDVLLDDEGNFLSDEAAEKYKQIHFPVWFVEGSASAVENVYQFRNDMFAALCAKTAQGQRIDESIFLNYSDAVDAAGNPMYFDLMYDYGVDPATDAEVDNTNSAYVSGYLATLYLSDRASIALGNAPAITVENGMITDVSTERLRAGLNAILEDLHDGMTLDQVIWEISPVDENGAKLYENTDDFQAKFIKGTPTELDDGKVQYEYANRDEDSLVFVADYLSYLDAISNTEGRDVKANGSILLDVDTTLESPLESTGEYESDYYYIVDSNSYVESTVSNSDALASGGKSATGSAADAAADAAADEDADEQSLPAAA